MAGASYKIVIIEIIVSGPLVKVIDHTETKEVHTTIPLHTYQINTSIHGYMV